MKQKYCAVCIYDRISTELGGKPVVSALHAKNGKCRACELKDDGEDVLEGKGAGWQAESSGIREAVSASVDVWGTYLPCPFICISGTSVFFQTSMSFNLTLLCTLRWSRNKAEGGQV